MAANVGIGLTNSYYLLDVFESNATDFVARIMNNNISTNADGLRIELATPSAGANNFLIGFYDNSTLGATPNGLNIGAIAGDGTGVNYATASDRRLKKNIVDISNALEIISGIRPRQYQFRSMPGKSEYGFIAQELQLVYPQAVTGSPNNDHLTRPMGVDYGRLTPILVAAIKEQQKKIEELQEQLELLQSTIEESEKNQEKKVKPNQK